VTIARFRVRHQQALAGLLIQSLKLCAAAGMVRLGLVALDGTKVAANAADRANRTHAKLEEQVAEMLQQAAEVDRAEDQQHGGGRGDALPSAASGWSPAGSSAPAPMIPPMSCGTSAAAGRASCVAPACGWFAPPGGEPMPHPRPPTDTTDAAERARAWLAVRHRWNRDLVVVLLRHAPEADVARALDRLSAGELGRLARLLAQATDLHEIARRIVADLQQQLDANVGSIRRPR
jgi:hypothetical protein